MREIQIENNNLILKIDDIQQPLDFTIGVLFMSEKKYGSIIDGLKNMDTAEGVLFYTTEILNAAIKKYNREYNGNEKPININEITNVIKNIKILDYLKFFIYDAYLRSQPVGNSRNTKESNTKPSAAGFIAMGVSKLGFSKAEILDMTLKELSDYINFYIDSIGTKKDDEITVPDGAEVEGVGTAEDLLRKLRGK